MNDPKTDIKKFNKVPLKLPANDEPWGPQQPKKTIQLLDKVDRYLHQKGSNDLEIKIMEEWIKK